MMNRFKKVLSLLTAIALLISGALALAEETIEAPVVESEPVQVEEIAQEPAPAQEEAAAQEELPIIEKEIPAQEEATAQEAAPAAELETDFVPSYNIEETPAEETPAQEEAPAEETPAQEEAPAEETPAQEEAPVEETPAQEEVPAEETSAQEETPAEETSAQEEAPAADPFDGDPAANDKTYTEDELITIDDDNWGYVDPEIISDYIPEITTELKFPGMEELKLNDKVSGAIDAENDAQYFIKLGSNKTIVLDLVASSEKVNVTINSKAVKFVRDEESATYNATYTMNVAAGQEYVIVLTADTSVKYKLVAEAAQAAEETEEATEEKVVEETAEETTEEAAEEEVKIEETVDTTNEAETEATEEAAEEETKVEETVETNEVETEATEKEVAEEETKEEETVETNEVEAEATEEEVAEEETKEEEIVEEPVEEKNEENTSEEEGIEDSDDESNIDVETTEEEPVPAMVGWIVADADAYTIGETATLTATSESELGNQVTWQTKVQDGEWATTGYGNALTVVLTEENANNIYRFKMEDGNFSDEIQLAIAEAEVEKQTEVEEEITENETEEAVVETFEHEEALDITVEYSDANPVFGTVAVLKASTIDEKEYTIQWQYSTDDENWIDIEGQNSQIFPVEITVDNFLYYWRAVARYNDESVIMDQVEP